MPIAPINGAEINYKIVGNKGPWVVVMQGGRHPLDKMEPLAVAIAARGCRVILHDRRNCGSSSLDFTTIELEDDCWVDDLRALLRYIGVKQAVVVGQSRSARCAIRFTLRYREQTRGLALWGLSGGPLAARFLADYYFGKYLRACEEGGMNAVCALDHFAGLIAARPANRDTLLAVDPVLFASSMSRCRERFLIDETAPVLGVTDDELRKIRRPTVIVPWYDRMHSHASVQHALKLIPGSQMVDFDPTRHDSLSIAETDISKDTAIVAKILCDFEASLGLLRVKSVFRDIWSRFAISPANPRR